MDFVHPPRRIQSRIAAGQPAAVGETRGPPFVEFYRFCKKIKKSMRDLKLKFTFERFFATVC